MSANNERPVAFITFKNTGKRYAIHNAFRNYCGSKDTYMKCSFFSKKECSELTHGLCLLTNKYFTEAPRDNEE